MTTYFQWADGYRPPAREIVPVPAKRDPLAVTIRTAIDCEKLKQVQGDGFGAPARDVWGNAR